MKSKIPFLNNKNKRTVDNIVYRVSNRNRFTDAPYSLKEIKEYKKPLTVEELKNKLNKN